MTQKPRLARRTGEHPHVDRRLPVDDVIAISHDLRGPLAVIALEVSMLEDTLPAERPDVAHALARIGKNLRVIDNLVHDLLDLAAIDAARFVVHTEPTELCGLVAEVVERVVSTRDHDRVSVAADGVMYVQADARRIERVVANLVHNALKYAPAASPISVVVKRSIDHACVTVIDAGPGMPPDDATRVFEKFRRGRATSRQDGNGLGLYVSHKIVTAHGGTMGVDSVFGRGSQFYFTLRLSDSPPM
jgi:signal transduction histidine kinase